MSTDLAATTGTWEIDPTHSTIGFVARHAMVAKVRGGFSDFTGTLTLDGSDPAQSSASLTIVASSFSTLSPAAFTRPRIGMVINPSPSIRYGRSETSSISKARTRIWSPGCRT